MKNILLPFIAIAALAASLHAQRAIVIEDFTDPTQVIPISISGFSGEVDNVLRFNLEVLGFEIVPANRAHFHLTGKNSDRVEGRLRDRSEASRLARAYSRDFPLRAQAHALANDVVAEIRKTPPIFHTRIAFRGGTGKGSEIFVADFDGFNPVQATRDGSDVASPAWVRGEAKLFYTSYRSGFADIYAHDLRSGRREVFSRYPGSNLTPAVSSDGKRVAMILSARGNPNLYVANADGTDLRQLTKTKGEQSSPAWSPDGREIVFTSTHDGGARLFRINADGSNMRPINTAPVTGLLTEPDWSPDGQKIAFTSQVGRQFRIAVVSPQGGDAEVLVDGEDPSWAPNSRTLIFVRRQNNARVLSLLDVPTKRVKDVRQIAGSCSQPSWAR